MVKRDTNWAMVRDDWMNLNGLWEYAIVGKKITMVKKYEGKTRIVFLHHHPFDDVYFTALKGHRKLLKAVKNNCELLLFGHEHKYGIWWNYKGVPLIVSSHKSSLPMSGACLMGTVIEIENVGTPQVSFHHKLVAF